MSAFKNRLAERINSLNFSDTSDDDQYKRTKSKQQEQNQMRRLKQMHRYSRAQDQEEEEEVEIDAVPKYNDLNNQRKQENKFNYHNISKYENEDKNFTHKQKDQLSDYTTNYTIQQQDKSKEDESGFDDIEQRILRLEEDLSKSLMSSKGHTSNHNKDEDMDISSVSFSLVDEKDKSEGNFTNRAEQERYKQMQYLSLSQMRRQHQDTKQQKQQSIQNTNKSLNLSHHQQIQEISPKRQEFGKKRENCGVEQKVRYEGYKMTNTSTCRSQDKRQDTSSLTELAYQNRSQNSNIDNLQTYSSRCDTFHSRCCHFVSVCRHCEQSICSENEHYNSNSCNHHCQNCKKRQSSARRSFDVFEKETEEIKQKVKQMKRELEDEEEDDTEQEDKGRANAKLNNISSDDEYQVDQSESKNQTFRDKDHKTKSILKNNSSINTNNDNYNLNNNSNSKNNSNNSFGHGISNSSWLTDKHIHESQMKLLKELENNNQNYSQRPPMHYMNFNPSCYDQQFSNEQMSPGQQQQQYLSQFPNHFHKQQFNENTSFQHSFSNQKSSKDSPSSRSAFVSNQESIIPTDKSEIISLLEREKQLLEEINHLRQRNVEIISSSSLTSQQKKGSDFSEIIGSDNSISKVQINDQTIKKHKNSTSKRSDSKSKTNLLPPQKQQDFAQLQKETDMLKQVERIRKNIQHSIKKKINEDKVVEKQVKQQIARSQKHSSIQSAASHKPPLKNKMVNHCENCSFLLNRGIPTTFCSCDQKK